MAKAASKAWTLTRAKTALSFENDVLNGFRAFEILVCQPMEYPNRCVFGRAVFPGFAQLFVVAPDGGVEFLRGCFHLRLFFYTDKYTDTLAQKQKPRQV